MIFNRLEPRAKNKNKRAIFLFKKLPYQNRRTRLVTSHLHLDCNQLISNMNTTSIIRRNRNGGLYAVGEGFTEVRWMDIAEVYEKLLHENDGKCSIRKVAAEARICKNSAQKAIPFYEVEMVLSTRRRQGHGTLKGLKMKRHQAILCFVLS